jgi:phosphate-selective porin OprO/OprP
MAQERPAPLPSTNSSYGYTAAPSDDYVATNANAAEADSSDLAQRLADVEKTLKKYEDKAKADKEKAASAMTVTPGGRIQIDTANFDQNAIDSVRANEKNGTEFRTARLALYGGGFNVIKYQIEYDLAVTNTSSSYYAKCKDTYIQITDLPLLQNIQIGHFKEPFSLDELTSDNYITFMERNIADDIMAPKRHLGIMAFGNSELERATYAIGAFNEYDIDGGVVQADNAGGAVTMRGTYLPWYDEATDGRGLIHTGLAYSYRQAYSNQSTLQFRPESYLAVNNKYNSTGILNNVDYRNEICAETAMVYGPFSVQSEYYVNYIDRTGSYADCKVQGAYAYVSYFLTGENRPYDRKRGVFGRVKPIENFFRVRGEDGNAYTGKGAWELKYRYSWMDAFDDGKLGFDTAHDQTVGLNWYLNPYTRMMFEYVRSDINQNTGLGNGELNIFQARAQIDF